MSLPPSAGLIKPFLPGSRPANTLPYDFRVSHNHFIRDTWSADYSATSRANTATVFCQRRYVAGHRLDVMTTREDLTFASGTDRCAAWWYPARGATTPGPVVVMAHGLSGTRRDRLGAFAERFADAGFAAMVFDHRGFGDSEGEPDLFEPARQLQDWRAAIAYARTRPDVDPRRMVTFGSSMGGGNALAAAAEDPRIAAAISQVPFLDIVSQAYRGPLSVRLRTLLTAVRGGYLPAVGQPHEPAFINAPDSENGWRHVVAIGEDSRWRNRVSARWLLGRPFRPARAARDLHCPWLVCVGEQDQVAAPGPAIRAARRAPRAELRLYPGVDHFDIYDGPEHEALVTDQITFLHRHLGAHESTSTRHHSHDTATT